MSGPAKTGHVGTKYILLLNKSFRATGIEYCHSVTCVIKQARLLETMGGQNLCILLLNYKKGIFVKIFNNAT